MALLWVAVPVSWISSLSLPQRLLFGIATVDAIFICIERLNHDEDASRGQWLKFLISSEILLCTALLVSIALRTVQTANQVSRPSESMPMSKDTPTHSNISKAAPLTSGIIRNRPHAGNVKLFINNQPVDQPIYISSGSYSEITITMLNRSDFSIEFPVFLFEIRQCTTDNEVFWSRASSSAGITAIQLMSKSNYAYFHPDVPYNLPAFDLICLPNNAGYAGKLTVSAKDVKMFSFPLLIRMSR